MVDKALVIFAHPYSHYSRVNIRLLDSLSLLKSVQIHTLYDEYPDFYVDVEREQELLLQHDLIVFQHPIYWYSAPALLKEWIDAVLQKGFAYGPGGDALQGKRWLSSVSTGGSAQAYSPAGQNRYEIRQYLLPFEQTARLCGMQYLEPFIVHDSYHMSDEKLYRYCEEYRHRIEHLLAGELQDGSS